MTGGNRILRAGLLTTLLGVFGCGDASVISRVGRETALDAAAVQRMAIDGLPTEVHGAPWPDAASDQVVSALRLPNAYPSGARFRLVRPKDELSFRDRRLVLVFNDGRPPDEWAACDMTRNMAGYAPAFAPDGKGFSVFAVFCDGTQSIGRGHLEAPGAPHGDWSFFQREMRRLFDRIIGDFSGSVRN